MIRRNAAGVLWPPDQRFVGELVLDSWAGRSKQLVIVLGERGDRYLVAAPQPLRLAGRHRRAAAGELVAVPQSAIARVSRPA